MLNIIEISHLTYTYARTDQPVLRDVTFSAPPGQFLAIVGPTGAGKSTLCYCFNGAVPRLFGGEMRGNVVVAGLDTYENEIPVMAQHVGLVVQNARSQLFNVTVEGEVAFGCENLGIPRERIRRNLQEALAFVGLPGFEERQPSALSGGQQQRVAIACVLAMEPEVLLLDEPTSELDPMGSEQVMEVIARLNRELGKTVVLVTHDTEFVAQYADRVLVLYQGCLVSDSTPRETFSQPELMARVQVRPPQVCEAAFALSQRGFPIQEIPMTVEEANMMIQRLRHG
jgi:energy-coupling factor transporter ATP-binding protein EcfA2